MNSSHKNGSVGGINKKAKLAAFFFILYSTSSAMTFDMLGQLIEPRNVVEFRNQFFSVNFSPSASRMEKLPSIAGFARTSYRLRSRQFLFLHQGISFFERWSDVRLRTNFNFLSTHGSFCWATHRPGFREISFNSRFCRSQFFLLSFECLDFQYCIFSIVGGLPSGLSILLLKSRNSRKL